MQQCRQVLFADSDDEIARGIFIYGSICRWPSLAVNLRQELRNMEFSRMQRCNDVGDYDYDDDDVDM